MTSCITRSEKKKKKTQALYVVHKRNDGFQCLVTAYKRFLKTFLMYVESRKRRGVQVSTGYYFLGVLTSGKRTTHIAKYYTRAPILPIRSAVLYDVITFSGDDFHARVGKYYPIEITSKLSLFGSAILLNSFIKLWNAPNTVGL